MAEYKVPGPKVECNWPQAAELRVTARIAYCITTLDTGGAERQLVEKVTRLPRERFAPAVIALAPPPTCCC